MKKPIGLLLALAACGGDGDVLVKQRIGIDVVTGGVSGGGVSASGLDNLWVTTGARDQNGTYLPTGLAHSSDGETWQDVPLGALPFYIQWLSAADDGAAWIAGPKLADGRPGLSRVHVDGQLEDFSAVVPPDAILSSVRAGGGGVFVSIGLLENNALVGTRLLRFDGAGFVDAGTPPGFGEAQVLAVLGPDEAVVSLGGASLYHHVAGAFTAIPWSDPSNAPFVRVGPDGSFWLWRPSFGATAGVAVTAAHDGRFTPVTITDLPLGDSAFELVPLGSGTAAVVIDHALGAGRSELRSLHIDEEGRTGDERHLVDCVPGECSGGAGLGLILPDGAVRLFDTAGYWWAGTREDF